MEGEAGEELKEGRGREEGRMRKKSSRRKERGIGEREEKMPFLKIIPFFFFVKTRPTFERVGRGCHNNCSNYIYICHVII